MIKERFLMIKTIGIIGSGMIGSALARLTVRAGFNVVMSNSRGPETLAGLIAELGPRARAASVVEAAEVADLVIATVPMHAYIMLPADQLVGKIVIDTMNYYPSRDNRIPDIDAAKLTTSEMIQQHLKGSKIVKALHNLDFHHLFTNARPHGDVNRTTLPIAGDDVEAKEKVAEFMDAIGYDSLDIGTLSDSWRIEPGTPIYVLPYMPNIPDGLTEEEAKKWYVEHSGDPLSATQVRELVEKAVRTFPVGGFPEELPAFHTDMVAEIYKNRKNERG
jgi:8-hydroxy-5-deazaflavin:NADPH oxidoreductase